MITARFEVPGGTATQYDEVIRRLEDAGLGAPDGRLLHVASPAEGGWSVLDVWESPAQLEAFAQRLMPILVDVFGEPPQPAIAPTHALVTA